ncbi:MAG: hypothetical protein WB460_04055 [Candidatus Acidiferrales bacterium]
MTTQGTRIMLDINDTIDRGVYADIFRVSEGPLVYKLFIGFRHDTTVSQGLTDPEDDHRRRKTFESECRAYEIAAQDAFLRGHIPGSFRRCEIADVVEDGKSVAADYLLACGYAMDYIEGFAAKLRTVGHLAHIREAEQAFHRAGIAHTSDASIFIADDPEKFTFIDFVVEAFPPPPWLFKS